MVSVLRVSARSETSRRSSSFSSTSQLVRTEGDLDNGEPEPEPENSGSARFRATERQNFSGLPGGTGGINISVRLVGRQEAKDNNNDFKNNNNLFCSSSK